MLRFLTSALGLAEAAPTAPHIETRRVRIDAAPRRCDQAYGAPYFAVTCSDGTVAIMLDAETHRSFGALRPGEEITLKGRWSTTHVVRLQCDRVFHIEALA